MKPREQYDNVRNALIEDIEFITLHKQPNGWLPITASAIVYPDEDDIIEEFPMLEHCRILEFFGCGECCATTIESGDNDPYGLSEFLPENLITIWERYVQLAVEQSIWKENAISYLKENTEFSEEKIESLVSTQWKPEYTFSTNLQLIRQQEEKKELWIFSYPMNRFERNASDEEIINDYENNQDADSLVVKMTPQEFTALINDEMFNDMDNWVRVIELPLNR